MLRPYFHFVCDLFEVASRRLGEGRLKNGPRPVLTSGHYDVEATTELLLKVLDFSYCELQKVDEVLAMCPTKRKFIVQEIVSEVYGPPRNSGHHPLAVTLP